jgi:hypothetical protein
MLAEILVSAGCFLSNFCNDIYTNKQVLLVKILYLYIIYLYYTLMPLYLAGLSLLGAKHGDCYHLHPDLLLIRETLL